MLNIGFLACTRVELYDLTVCIVVNDNDLDLDPDNAQYRTLLSYFDILQFSNFMFLD